MSESFFVSILDESSATGEAVPARRASKLVNGPESPLRRMSKLTPMYAAISWRLVRACLAALITSLCSFCSAALRRFSAALSLLFSGDRFFSRFSFAGGLLDAEEEEAEDDAVLPACGAAAALAPLDAAPDAVAAAAVPDGAGAAPAAAGVAAAPPPPLLLRLLLLLLLLLLLSRLAL